MEHQTDMQLDQIKQQMSLLAQQANTIKKRIEISEMIYHAEIRFEPLISHIYHLYQDENGNFFLMMIGEKEWGRKKCPLKFISSVKLLADHTWEVIK
jgi:CO dehydrogenase nickel-insertion accessory protein CooC1